MASLAELQKRAQIMIHEGRLRTMTGEKGKEEAIVAQLKKELAEIQKNDAKNNAQKVQERNQKEYQEASQKVGDFTKVAAHDRKGSEGVKGHNRKLKPGERGQAIAKEMLQQESRKKPFDLS
jgi:RNA 3'-terminal phosphate cyclase